MNPIERLLYPTYAEALDDADEWLRGYRRGTLAAAEPKRRFEDVPRMVTRASDAEVRGYGHATQEHGGGFTVEAAAEAISQLANCGISADEFCNEATE